jgi:CBS domain-containing protein
MAAEMSWASSPVVAKGGFKNRVSRAPQYFLFKPVVRGLYSPTLAGPHFGGGTMATIRDLLINRTIHYIQPGQTVVEAARYMVDCHIGAAPVLEGTKLVGIFSERDIMSKVVTQGLDPRTTRIADVMSTTLRTLTPESSCAEAMVMMQEHGIRHLAVCEGSTLVGFLSLRDLLRHTLDEKSGEADMMRAYIQTSV